MNIVFPPYIMLTTRYVEISRWTASYGILDENSTLCCFSFVSSPAEYDLQTYDTVPSQPSGWFNLTIKIPFKIPENWTKICVRAFFFTGTCGGVWYFWKLKWQLHNNINITISDEWSHSLDVDPHRPTTLWRDNIEYHIWRDKNDSSIYTPNGQWFWETTLTVDKATRLSYATTYQIYYNLFLETFLETTSEKPHFKYSASLYPTITAETTLTIILALQITNKIKVWKRKILTKN